MLPNCLVIGAPRSGTTSVYEHLNAHPDVYMSPVQEPDFFSLRSLEQIDPPGSTRSAEEEAQSCSAYHESLCQYTALFDGAGETRIRGEASAVYLPHPCAAANIRKYVPDAKLIAILRDPAERFHSHYEHTRRIRSEQGGTVDQDQQLQEDLVRAIDYAGSHGLSGLEDTEPAWWLRIGFYHQHLTRFHALFPKAQMRVLLFEDLARDSQGFMTEIFRFLEIDDSFTLPTTAAFNATVAPRSKGVFRFFTTRNPVMRYLRSVAPASLRGMAVRTRNSALGGGKPTLLPEMRRKLVSIYREDIEQLQGLLEKDLSAWLR
jgi:hypothetical protein